MPFAGLSIILARMVISSFLGLKTSLDFMVILRVLWGISPYNGTAVSPLHARAWTMQEQIHARRLIKFTAREMTFQCMERTFCEYGELNERGPRGYVESFR